MMNRRELLRGMATVSVCAAVPCRALSHPVLQPDFRLSIKPARVEIAPGVTIETTTYNGSVPGPTLHLREGQKALIEVTNNTSNADIVHWHGLRTDSINDGAMEEGSPMIEPGAKLLYHIESRPGGTRWYHTHAGAGDRLDLGTYSGQFGFLLISRASDGFTYDQEFNLAIHHWGGHFVPMVETMRMQSANVPLTTGSDVGYQYATFNGHMLGAGEPLRVKTGQRALFRLLNASATENTVLALPGHTFQILAMDGNRLTAPKRVEVLSLAVAERIDAIVEMNHPGVWVLGSTLKAARDMGCGIVVEYAEAKGSPQWIDPPDTKWNYGWFCAASALPEVEKDFVLTIRDNGPDEGSRFDRWTINNQSWPNIDPLIVETGKRYRLTFRNGSGDQHPVHLHRHSFEIVRIDDRPVRGLLKDTVNLMPMQTMSVDFIADDPGDTLWHCHQQLHMDYGFMQLIRYKKGGPA